MPSDFESPFESSDDDTGMEVVTKPKTHGNEVPGPSEVQQSVSVVEMSSDGESESEVKEVDNKKNRPQIVCNFKKRDFTSTILVFTSSSGNVQQYFSGKDTATDIF